MAATARKLNFTWNLSAKQRELFESDARFRVGMMGRRSGKNEVGSACVVDYSTQPEEYDFGADETPVSWWIGPTYRQAYLYGFLKVKEKLPDVLIDEDETRGSEWGPSKITFTDGTEIEFLSYGNPSGLQGAGVDLIIGDEWAYSDRSVWDNDLRPMLMDSGGGAVFISKPLGENPFYELYKRGATEDKPYSTGSEKIEEWYSVHATSYENPVIPDGEVDKAKQTTPESVFRQEYLADPRSGGTLLTLDMLDYDPYSTVKEDERLKWHVAVDIGVKMDKQEARDKDTDYWAAALVAERPRKNNPDAWLVDVLRKRGQTPAQAAQWLATITANVPTNKVYIEAVAAQEWFLRDAKNEGLTPIPVEHNRPKKERITFLSVPFNNGNVKLVDWSEVDRDVDWSDFRTEWAGFPNGDHDDQLDAVEMALRHVDFSGGVSMFGANPYNTEEQNA